MHARNDARVTTAPARAAARTKLDTALLNEIDPDNKLSADERERRLQHARSAHFAALAYKRISKKRGKR